MYFSVITVTWIMWKGKMFYIFILRINSFMLSQQCNYEFLVQKNEELACLWLHEISQSPARKKNCKIRTYLHAHNCRNAKEITDLR